MYIFRKDREVNSTYASGLGIVMIANRLGIDVIYGMVHGSGWIRMEGLGHHFRVRTIA